MKVQGWGMYLSGILKELTQNKQLAKMVPNRDSGTCPTLYMV